MGESREIFLSFCNDLAEELKADEFKSTEKGQLLTKTAANKDIKFQIYLQSSLRNEPSNVVVIPHIWIKSKKTKQWLKEKHHLSHPSDIVYANNIGYFCKKRSYLSWNASPQALDEILLILKENVFPVFTIFDDIPNSIEFLANNGTKFNPHLDNDSLLPMAYMLSYASIEAVQKFCTLFVENCTYRKDIAKLGKNLQSKKDIDIRYSEFIGASALKLAYLHGIKF